MKVQRKLVLNKETVKVLNQEQMNKAAGGTYVSADCGATGSCFCDDLPPTYAIGCGDGSGSGGRPSEFCDMIC